MKKILSTFLILMLLVSAKVSFAADSVKDAGADIKTCVKTYVSAMPSFLQTIVSAEGFVENFMAYFIDLVSRSSCQLAEIMTLDSKLDALTKQLQQAYLKCDLNKVTKLQKKYIEAKAEIFYVRHLINATVRLEDIIGDIEVTVDDIKENEYVDRAMFIDLYDVMSAKYEPLMPIEGDFDEMYSNLEIKYETRKYEYLLCGEGEAWKRVGEKFKEFITTWGGTKEAINDTGKGIVKEAKSIGKSAEEFKLRYKKNASNQPAGAFKNFLQNTFQTSINNVDPETGLTEIFENAATYFPGDTNPDLAAVYTVLSNESDVYALNMSRATVEAKYKALYAGVTDAAVSSFIENLNVLLDTIKSTAIPVDQLNKCASKVLGKQCK